MVSAPPAVIDTSDMDPELARYLNRNYWQQKSVEMKSTTSTTQPSAPSIAAETKTVSSGGVSNVYPVREEEVNVINSMYSLCLHVPVGISRQSCVQISSNENKCLKR
jgi:hypothetical protein